MVKKILIVDDEESIRETLQMYLDVPGIKIDLAESAFEALKRIQDCDYDCLISDLNMPGRSGLEFLSDLRSREINLPFILFSGSVSEKVRSEVIDKNAAVVEKPDLQNLMREVDEILLKAA